MIRAAVILLVTAAACTGAPMQPTPQVIYQPPPPAAAPAPDILTFLDHLGTVSGQFEDHFQTAASAADSGNYDTMRATIATGAGIIQSELDWLAAHPPLPCYAAIHTSWQATLEQYARGYDTIALGLTPPVSATVVSLGIEQVSTATPMLNRTADLISQHTCTP